MRKNVWQKKGVRLILYFWVYYLFIVFGSNHSSILNFFHCTCFIKTQKNKPESVAFCQSNWNSDTSKKGLNWIRWGKSTMEKISTGKCVVLPLHSANYFHTATCWQHQQHWYNPPFLKQHTIQLISSSLVANTSNVLVMKLKFMHFVIEYPLDFLIHWMCNSNFL